MSNLKSLLVIGLLGAHAFVAYEQGRGPIQPDGSLAVGRTHAANAADRDHEARHEQRGRVIEAGPRRRPAPPRLCADRQV